MNDKLTQKEGWLTREEVEAWKQMAFDAEKAPKLNMAESKRQFAVLCNMALYALNGPPAVDWMPIESAPKDGTLVLLGSTDTEWPLRCRRYVQEPYPHWRGESGDTDATHWLPLPPAPTDHKEPHAL